MAGKLGRAMRGGGEGESERGRKIECGQRRPRKPGKRGRQKAHLKERVVGTETLREGSLELEKWREA